MLPRYWLAGPENLWTCPGCGKPAVLWFLWLFTAPRWRCTDCRMNARLDASSGSGEPP